jgi:hypothetical protein
MRTAVADSPFAVWTSHSRGSHLTFRSPIPSHCWRHEERHDQLAIVQSD